MATKFDVIEKTFIQELLKGVNMKNAARNLNIPEHKIYKISKNIKNKLGAKNMPNAIYIAYKNHLIK